MGGADHYRPHDFRPLVAKWASFACLKADIDGLPLLNTWYVSWETSIIPVKRPELETASGEIAQERRPTKTKEIRVHTYFKVSAGTYSQCKWYYTTSTKARSVVKYLHVPSDLVVAKALMLCSWPDAATTNIS